MANRATTVRSRVAQRPDLAPHDLRTVPALLSFSGMTPKLRTLLRTLLVAVAAIGCAGPNAFRASAAPRIEASAPSVTDHHVPCVMEVMGAGLRFAEQDDGIVLSFRTVDPAQVDALRAATSGLARVYDGTIGETRYGRPDRGERLTPAQMGLPAVETRVEPTGDGARLYVSAADEADAAPLRERLGVHARMMQRGACPLFAPRGLASVR